MEPLLVTMPDDDSGRRNGRHRTTDNDASASDSSLRDAFDAGWKAGHAAGIQEGYWQGRLSALRRW